MIHKSECGRTYLARTLLSLSLLLLLPPLVFVISARTRRVVVAVIT
jgi:hypothetical protein